MCDTRDIALINTLLREKESECLEFKVNNTDPDLIGKLCSALSNAARIHNKSYAYVLWGVDDNGSIIGTDFNPDTIASDGSIRKFRLAQLLKPPINCDFRAVEHPSGRVVMLEIPATSISPTEFKGTAYVRIGSATPKLSDHMNKMQTLIKNLQTYTWESDIAKSFLSAGEVLYYLDYQSYFKLTKQVEPQIESEILQYFESDKIIEKDIDNKWNILNLGAILYAKNLNHFDQSLARKGVRFVAYSGNNRSTKVIDNKDGSKGYATSLEGLVKYINNLLPSSETIGEIYREKDVVFPQVAIRELVANALIHQDMMVKGAGPLIELFNDRLEITNPGSSLNPADRMIDLPPRSRNEKLAGLMRRMGLCEELGSGIDKVVFSIEESQLPAPKFQIHNESTHVTLYSHKSFANLTSEERVRACYQHSVIRYISGKKLKNSSLRSRFGIQKGNESQVTTVINNARSKELIKYADDDSPRSGYHPFWA